MSATPEGYVESLLAWRARAEESLRAEDGWISLAGLFWLKEGSNRLGSNPDGEIVLPADSVPAFVAEICLRKGEVTVGVAHDMLTMNAGPPDDLPLRDDSDPAPDLLRVGRFSMQLIRRGSRVGLRLRDSEHPARVTFAGRRWYPVRADLCVEASYVPYDQPRPILIANILGDVEERRSPGYVVFSADGQTCRLDATAGSGGGLFFNFRDRTSGAETYPAGRFLTTDAPKDGKVVLDFNRAYNPPCAFTEFATCPLPPPQNILGVPISAGELAPKQ